MGSLARYAALAAVTAAVALSGTAHAQTAAIKALAQAADKEGELLLTWSSNTLGGAEGAKAFQAAINKRYGTDIQIKWTPGPSMPNVGNQIAMAYNNKLDSPTDVYMGFSRNFGVLLKHDLFLKAPYKDYVPDRLTDAVVEKGTYVKVSSATLGFSYNKKLAPFEPKEIADFLKPEWKGKVATTSFGAGWDQVASEDAWGPDKAIAFAKKFSEQVAGFMRCSETERLTSGEFLALITDCSGSSTRDAVKQGAPLGRTIEPTVPLVSYFYLAVPKNAVHPNAGKLFIAFSATEEGQDIIREQTSGDLHLFPGSLEGDIIARIEKERGVKFKDADIDWQVANKAGNKGQQAIKDIMQRGK